MYRYYIPLLVSIIFFFPQMIIAMQQPVAGIFHSLDEREGIELGVSKRERDGWV